MTSGTSFTGITSIAACLGLRRFLVLGLLNLDEVFLVFNL